MFPLKIIIEDLLRNINGICLVNKKNRHENGRFILITPELAQYIDLNGYKAVGPSSDPTMLHCLVSGLREDNK